MSCIYMSITLEKRKLTTERTSSIDYVDVEFTERAQMTVLTTRMKI